MAENAHKMAKRAFVFVPMKKIRKIVFFSSSFGGKIDMEVYLSFVKKCFFSLALN
jgi:Holliday junction resolvase